ncbi:hypothetical protein WN71_024080 [Streptomyces mangrovisoli]|uniref:Uncharacterized protein n=1 Tax=Streptomyces mangrovisoli TaxID=1428628 RepID=A0A1J4NTB8_9ACTN|nr:hypothetical protein WN71_024080 [Streptomyces mangrovisoli]
MEVFTRILRERAAEPDAVGDVDVAWDAFAAFLQVEVEGIAGSEDDGDGFIVEWGRWHWNDDLPALSFGRLYAVTDAEAEAEAEAVAEAEAEADGADGADDGLGGQPQYWKVELQLVFAEDPAWADLDSLGHQDTGFDHDGIGPPRAAALREMRRFVESHPQLAAMWRAEPVRSALVLERAG